MLQVCYTFGMMSQDLETPDLEERIVFPSLDGLRSTKSTHRLNQIARVRVKGVGDYISLPQLVVCGDQSVGKSSVLEGITGIPFPRQDGVCTKFATEIILHHHEKISKITATVIPHKSRSRAQRNRLNTFHQVLADFSELPRVISEAGTLMQLRGLGADNGPSFGEDVLRIEVTGNTGLHLTVVDLPGLISVVCEEQTEEDVELVGRLVDTYLQSSRTIILAVIQASNDIANQGIIQRARKFDPAGQRTVGIITKPDLVNKGTEGRIALLAKNQDTTKLKLGYFLLKNPSPSELARHITLEKRRRRELEFFSSPTWKMHQLDLARVGIAALRRYLQELLDGHIEKELPKVRKEIKSYLTDAESRLAALGDERPSPTHMRMFLTRLSMEFHGLVQSALDGNYQEKGREFFGDSGTRRLRAEIHRLNGVFSMEMWENGQKRKIDNLNAPGKDPDRGSKSNSETGPLVVTTQEFDAWVKEIYFRTRGLELPGNYNHMLLAELFQEQSSRWADITNEHLTSLFDLTADFIQSAMGHVVREEAMKRDILVLANSLLEERKKLAYCELAKLLADEKRHPITYNQYYTENIRTARESSLKSLLRKAMLKIVKKGWHVDLNNSGQFEEVLVSLQEMSIVNMDDQACAEAIGGLEAYYNVALKTFVDNVCRQVVERHILSGLPDIFAPTTVMNFSDEYIIRIASEPEQQKEQRVALLMLVESFRESLLELQN